MTVSLAVGDLCNGRPQYVERSWDVVREHLDREDDPEVVEAAVYALGHMAANDYARERMIPEARELLLAHTDATSSEVRLAVARDLPWFLGVPEDTRVLAGLIALTRDPEDTIRDWATFGLAQMIDVDTVDVRAALVDRLADEHEDTREEAMMGLARRRDPVAKETVLVALTCDSVGTYPGESAALLGDDDFLPLLIALRDWWDVDPELLEKAISRCDPVQRAASEAQWQQVLGGIRQEFDCSPMELIGVDIDDDPHDLDRAIRVEWKDAAGDAQWASFDLDRVLLRDDVLGDAATAARRMVEMLDANSSPR
jgi:hypothetical protein